MLLKNKETFYEYLKKQDVQIVPSVNSKWKEKKYHIQNNNIQNAKLRTTMPDEIIIEFDTEDKWKADYYTQKIIQKIKDNYHFYIYEHDGRSPHIHIYNIIGLKNLSEKNRTKYKKLFLKKYVPKEYPVDYSLTNKHLLALEYAPHFKHGVVKKLVYYNDYKINGLESDILAVMNTRLVSKRIKKKEKIEESYCKRLYEFLTKEKLKSGGRDLLLYKNLAICLYSNPDREILVYNVAKVQEPNNPTSVVNMFNGWFNWIKEEGVRKVWKSEIRKYCELFGYDYKKIFYGDNYEFRINNNKRNIGG